MYLVYILRCADHTFYTGVTNDLKKRLLAHNEGTTGARYTRGRRPVEVVYTEECGTKGDALRRESAIKKLTREQKIALMQ